MKFKGIEVYGFKSFADKSSVNFQEGITAIVGPNGCGKSNVVDAIRWVLGEQSAKILRGSKMSDVIFNGTERRKAMSYCEVALKFDNSANPERIFKTLPFDEVVISRKLFRNDSSEFYINGVQAKLKDVRAIIRETGLGREGYSIIGQGKIDEIVKSKPENRRAIFEDAAGVLGSKQARKDAIKNLADYEVNRQNTEALLAEMERSVLSLEKQAENAKKALEIRDELRKLEANSYVFQKDNNAAQKIRINEKIKGYKEQFEQLQRDAEACDKKFEELTEKQKQLDEQLSSLRKEQTELAVKQADIKGQGNTYAARLEGLLTTKEDYSKRLADLEDILSSINRDYRDYLSRKSMAEEDKLQVDKDYNEKVSRQNELMSEILKREQALQVKNEEINKLLESVGDIKENYGKIQAQAQSSLDRIDELNKDISDVQEKIDNNEYIRSQMEVNVDKLKADSEKLDATILRLSNRYNELIDEIDELNDKSIDLKSQIEALSSKIGWLDQMIKSYEGYTGSVKALLQASDRDPFVKSKILGVVANLMRVPEKYQLAIEVALGANIQNIVVNDEYAARDVIAYQKQNRIGRVTFIPLTSYRERNIDPSCAGILREKGCFGVASRLISYDDKYYKVFSGLLGNTVIVDNVDTGIQLSRKYNSQVKIVTLEGEIFNTTGSISGGDTKSNKSGLLTQEETLRQYKDELKRLKVDYDESLQKLKESKDEYSDLDEQITEYESEYKDVFSKYTNEKAKYDTIIDVLVELNTSLEKTNNKKKEEEARYQTIQAALARVSKENSDFSDSKLGKSDESRAERAEFEQIKLEKKEIDEEVTELRLQRQELENTIKTCNENLERLEEERKRTNENIKLCRDVLASNDGKIKTTDMSIKSSVLSQEDAKRLKELETVIAQYEEAKKPIVDKLRELSTKKDELAHEQLSVNDKKNKAEASLISMDEKMIALEARIMEEYNLDYEGALEYKVDDFDYEEAQGRIRSLKASKASLGSVNYDAIEQYQIEKARYDAKHVEYDDLLKAEEDIKKVISDLSKEILEKFNTEFEKINTNFQTTFKELFGGGSGRLQILEPEEDQDPLDAGVEIFAQPPGKRITSMTSLSGGEQALTAMAILFAILRLRSMPFCVLDEVEAALDEGNVGVYAKYLKKFSLDTQFIVITHRKPTMEKADVLFGVTMQEKGVSKVVNVNLKEAVAHSTTQAEREFDKKAETK